MSANRMVGLNYSLEGKLLVAAPSWENQLFRQSVCLVVHHTVQGAVGIFLNRSMELDAEGLWKQLTGQQSEANNAKSKQTSLNAAEKGQAGLAKAGLGKKRKGRGKAKPCTLHFGGPKSGPVVALHNREELAEFSSAQGVYFAAQLSHLQQLLTEAVDETELKIIVGQADWPAGVLDAQFAAGCWLPLPVLPKLVFTDSPYMWVRALREVGNRFVVGLTGAHGQPDDILAN